MKKAISLILALVLCSSLCLALTGCGSSKYIGVYTREQYPISITAYIDKLNGYHPVSAGYKEILTISSGGTGRLKYITSDLSSNGDDFVILDCPMTWEVVDGYLYVSGSADWAEGVNYVFNRSSFSWNNERFVLEGKSLTGSGTYIKE